MARPGLISEDYGCVNDIETEDMTEGYEDPENAPDVKGEHDAFELNQNSEKAMNEIFPQLSILRQKISQLNALHQYAVKVMDSRGLAHETLDESNKMKDEENRIPPSVSCSSIYIFFLFCY